MDFCDENFKIIDCHFYIIRNTLCARKVLIDSGPYKCLEHINDCFLSPSTPQSDVYFEI